VTGTAPDALVFDRPNVVRSHVGTNDVRRESRFDRAVRREELTGVLVRSGFTRREARAAVDVGLAGLSDDAPVEECLRAAFRACGGRSLSS
jgi:hypothetical protein